MRATGGNAQKEQASPDATCRERLYDKALRQPAKVSGYASRAGRKPDATGLARRTASDQRSSFRQVYGFRTAVESYVENLTRSKPKIFNTEGDDR